VILLELARRFVVVSLLAFGGGQAALPLVERIAVAEMGIVPPEDFAAAVAFSYVTPGPVLILATFVGYSAAGVIGAAVATAAIFFMPWLLAAAAARVLQQLLQHPWLQAFGRAAGPAVVGLLGVTALSLSARSVTAWPYAVIVALSLLLALRTRVSPIMILLGGGIAGILIGAAEGTSP
jgi:chromate transporter